MKRSILCLSLLLSAILPLCSCEYHEIEDATLVAGIAVDNAPEQMQATIELVHSEDESGVSLTAETMSTSGGSLYEILENADKLSSRKLFWNHAQLIALPSSLAEEGIFKFADEILQNQFLRISTVLLIVKDSNPADVFKITTGEDKVGSYNLQANLSRLRAEFRLPDGALYKFYRCMFEEGSANLLPCVTIEDSGDGKIGIPYGSAVFRFDKLVGFMDMSETSIVALADNSAKNLHYVVKTDKGNVNVNIIKSRCKIKTDTDKDGRISASMDFTIHLNILEMPRDLNLNKDEEIKAFKKIAENQIKDDVMALSRRAASELKGDVFGFGEKLKNSNPKYWESVADVWHEHLLQTFTPDIAINVTIDGQRTTSRARNQ